MIRQRGRGPSVRVLSRAVGANVGSLAEATLLNRIERAGLPVPEAQARLIDGRRFRYDVAWRDYLVAVELQGGIHRVYGGKPCAVCGEMPKGRHTRGSAYESDAEKSALAQIQGYIVLYVTPGMVESGLAGRLIEAALQSHGWTPT